MNSHSHSAVISVASGPLATLLQVSGFLFVLLATGLIVMAVEQLHGE